MIIRTNKRENPFAQIDRVMLDRADMSWQAKGLLSFLLGKPDKWQIKMSHLIKQGTCGRDAMRSMMKELESFGYVKRVPARKPNGTIDGWDFEVFESPEPTDRLKTRPTVEPSPVEPSDGQSPPSNNSILSDKEESNTPKPPEGDVLFLEFMPASLKSSAFIETWTEWATYRRREKKVPITPTSAKKQFKQMEETGATAAIMAMEEAMASGWQGVFPKKASSRMSPAEKPYTPQVGVRR